jgi:hypothetical protein
MVCISRIVIIPRVVMVRIVPPIVTVRIVIRPVPLKPPVKWKVPRVPIGIVIRPIRSVIRSLVKPIKPSTVVCVVIVSHISIGFFYDNILYDSIIINSPIDIIGLRISGKCKNATQY